MTNSQPLPVLTGSDKQIAWASGIRTKIMADIDAQRATIDAMAPKFAGNEKAETAISVARAAFDQVAAQTKASWWIDSSHTTRLIASQFAIHADPVIVKNAKVLIERTAK